MNLPAVPPWCSPDAAADLAAVPAEVIDAFYLVRFGHRPLAPETVAALKGRLDALEMALKPA